MFWDGNPGLEVVCGAAVPVLLALGGSQRAGWLTSSFSSLVAKRFTRRLVRYHARCCRVQFS